MRAALERERKEREREMKQRERLARQVFSNKSTSVTQTHSASIRRPKFFTK